MTPTNFNRRESGLLIPGLTPQDRRQLRSRAYQLVAAIFDDPEKTKTEQAELERINEVLFGDGSGYRPDPTTAPHAAALAGSVAAHLSGDPTLVGAVIGDRLHVRRLDLPDPSEVWTSEQALGEGIDEAEVVRLLDEDGDLVAEVSVGEFMGQLD